MKANEEFIDLDTLELLLQTLTVKLDSNDVSSVRQILQEMVPGYLPSSEVVDWVHLAGQRIY